MKLNCYFLHIVETFVDHFEGFWLSDDRIRELRQAYGEDYIGTWFDTALPGDFFPADMGMIVCTPRVGTDGRNTALFVVALDQTDDTSD
jgi:hypothetical protein